MARFTGAALLAAALLAFALPAGGASRSPAGRTAFPVVVHAANGDVTIRARPTRIVSLSPSATESLYAVDAGAQVKAVDEFSDYPAGTPRTSISPFDPNAEAIVGLHPDLVILSSDTNRLIPALEAVHVPVLLETPPATLRGAYDQMRDLGKATGHLAEANRLVLRLRAKIAAVVRSVPRPARAVSVYHELSPDRFSATSNTFVGRVYKLFGLSNIADAAKAAGDYPQLTTEYVVSAGPDLIVLADTTCCGQTAATVAARPGWQSIPAVRKHAVVRLDDSIAARWGPRVVNFVRAVASALKTVHG